MGPLRHSYNSHGHGTNLLSANEVPLSHDIRHDTSSGGRIFESKSLGVGRGNHTLENGAHRHVGRRGSAHAKELDSFANIIEGKPSKRNQCGHRSQVLLPNFSGEFTGSGGDYEKEETPSHRTTDRVDGILFKECNHLDNKLRLLLSKKIGPKPQQMISTSDIVFCNNDLIRGAFNRASDNIKHVIDLLHKAKLGFVLVEPCRFLENEVKQLYLTARLTTNQSTVKAKMNGVKVKLDTRCLNKFLRLRGEMDEKNTNDDISRAMKLLDYKGILLSGCLVACTIVELLAMWNLIKVEVQLCNMLSPEGPRVSLRSNNWGLVFIAMLVDNSLQHREGIAPKFYITL